MRTTFKMAKHQKLYRNIGYVVILNFIVSSILYLTKVKDYIETLPIAQLLLVFVFILVFIHLMQYIRKNKQTKSDYILLIGLFLVLVCVAIESVSVYFVATISGIFIGIGMIILLFTNIFRTIRKIQIIEEKRHQTELEIEKKENKKITLQMMESLSTTIEAKDEYTRGTLKACRPICSLDCEKYGLDK